MGIAAWLILGFFSFLAFDRYLLFLERRYYAKYDKFMLPDTDPEDIKIEKG